MKCLGAVHVREDGELVLSCDPCAWDVALGVDPSPGQIHLRWGAHIEAPAEFLRGMDFQRELTLRHVNHLLSVARPHAPVEMHTNTCWMRHGTCALKALQKFLSR